MHALVVLHNGAVSTVHLAPRSGSEEVDCIENGLKNLKPEDTAGKKQVLTDCAKAPNPLVPATNELIWGSIGFIVVALFVMWKGYPAIKKTMQARSDKIRGDIEIAEASKTEAQSVLSMYQAQLADAKAESGRIIDEARLQADSLRKDLQARAEADMLELRTKAMADMETAKNRAVADLQSQVAALAIGAAGRIVEKNLDAESNTRLVESFIASVGAGK